MAAHQFDGFDGGGIRLSGNDLCNHDVFDGPYFGAVAILAVVLHELFGSNEAYQFAAFVFDGDMADVAPGHEMSDEIDEVILR